ncbi:MAG: ATP/GTP-binding protein [Candidatus Helarchaeota archaeon]
MTFVIFFIGSAGAGKSSLVGNFGKWIKERRKETVKLINLDPGAIYIPYRPDFNIRDDFTVEEIIKNEHIGPNGAIIRSNEIILKNFERYLEIFKNFNCEYILIDTPGQLEIFIFKDIALKILDLLSNEFRVIGINIIDSNLTRNPSELVIAHLISLILSFRLGIEIINIIHKSDLENYRKIEKFLYDKKFLIKSIKDRRGIMADLILPMLDHLWSFYPASKFISTSIYGDKGYEDLYDRINEHFCACGDLS